MKGTDIIDSKENTPPQNSTPKIRRDGKMTTKHKVEGECLITYLCRKQCVNSGKSTMSREKTATRHELYYYDNVWISED